jgi:hypothetical protein
MDGTDEARQPIRQLEPAPEPADLNPLAPDLAAADIQSRQKQAFAHGTRE